MYRHAMRVLSGRTHASIDASDLVERSDDLGQHRRTGGVHAAIVAGFSAVHTNRVRGTARLVLTPLAGISS